VGLHAGGYKLGLTDHSDMWTLGFLGNIEVKYRATPRFAIGVEGTWLQTYLADLSSKAPEDGAGLTTDKIEDGPRQRAQAWGLLAEYHFFTDKRWSPYVVGGSGLYRWRWTDANWMNLQSVDPALPWSVPTLDKIGNPYELEDEEIYLMGGFGMEFFPADLVSIDIGAKFRYLTHILTDFVDARDIVGTDPGELDLPKAVGELYAGVTFYLGSEKCPPLDATASADVTRGAAPLSVVFRGAIIGGCPDHTYSWDFGDGSFSSESTPRHSYDSPGDYSAVLTITDAKGATSTSGVPVTVTCPALAVTASASPSTGRAPLPVAFSGSATGGCGTVTYQWSFGDGSSSAESDPRHTYDAAGSYTATLTATDSDGTTSQKMVSLTVEEEFVPTPEKPVILEGVNFELDQAAITEDSKSTLDRVAESLIDHSDVNVEIGGHCDWTGTDDYNLQLSNARANAVRAYLIGKGVSSAQLTARGYGETQPIADNETKEGRAQNRRVELKLAE
jgi:outer membrane protein OmpA-like peptidoglycan-associated protein/opacity protein-like surface antigen